MKTLNLFFLLILISLSGYSQKTSYLCKVLSLADENINKETTVSCDFLIILNIVGGEGTITFIDKKIFTDSTKPYITTVHFVSETRTKEGSSIKYSTEGESIIYYLKFNDGIESILYCPNKKQTFIYQKLIKL